MMETIENKIKSFLSDEFGDKYECIDYDISRGDVIKYGYSIKLKANFEIKTKSFNDSGIKFEIKGKEIYIDSGCLEDMCEGLKKIIKQSCSQ